MASCSVDSRVPVKRREKMLKKNMLSYGTTQHFLQNHHFFPLGHVVRVEVISALHRGQVETSKEEELSD